MQTKTKYNIYITILWALVGIIFFIFIIIATGCVEIDMKKEEFSPCTLMAIAHGNGDIHQEARIYLECIKQQKTLLPHK